MAELAKKLHFKKSGTEQTAKAYSTAGEAGSAYIPSKIDGVACYVPIGATNDAMATNGRVIKGGTTYSIKSSASLPYTEVKYTTPGTFTFTAPSGVTRVRVAVIAGGGTYVPTYSNDTDVNTGHGATNSSFASVVATASPYTDDSDTITAGTPNGRVGEFVEISLKPYETVTVVGVEGFDLDFDIYSIGDYGAGGDWVWTNTTTMINPLQIEIYQMPTGGKVVTYLDVVPTQSYTVVVGQGAVNDVNATLWTDYHEGGNGAVLIAYGGDI